jgi:predicted rRNA methylase YqxC with S4 and FtsJ domains
VKDPVVHARILDEMLNFARTLNLVNLRVCDSPITGPAGNREFFIAGEAGKVASASP